MRCKTCRYWTMRPLLAPLWRMWEAVAQLYPTVIIHHAHRPDGRGVSGLEVYRVWQICGDCARRD